MIAERWKLLQWERPWRWLDLKILIQFDELSWRRLWRPGPAKGSGTLGCHIDNPCVDICFCWEGVGRSSQFQAAPSLISELDRLSPACHLTREGAKSQFPLDYRFIVCTFPSK